MATITAKFPGVCGRCGGRIQPGERISWTKGQQSSHVTCPGVGAVPAAPKPKAPRAPRQPRLVGLETGLVVSFEGSKYSREPEHALGELRWVKERGERVACVLVGYSPARWISGGLLEDMDEFQYGGRGAWLGSSYYRYATPAEYENLQLQTPRLDGVCAEARVAVALSRGLAVL